MDRDIPTFNPLVVGKMQQKNLQLHQQRLQNIRTSQNGRSFVSSSLNGRPNRKAQQLEEEKQTEIERHNVMLFNRMKRIMSRNDPHNKPQLNNRNNHRASVQLERIQEQNRTMYQRIESQKPTINNRKLQEERKKHLNILKFLGKYSAHALQSNNAQQAQSMRVSQSSSRPLPNPLRNKLHTAQPHYLYAEQEGNQQYNYNKEQRQSVNIEKGRYEDYDFDEEIVDEEDFKANLQKMIDAKRKPQRLVKTHLQTQKTETKSVESKLRKEIEQPKITRDIILFKTSTNVGGESCEVKIIRKHDSYQIRCQRKDGEPVIIEFSENQGNQLLEENNYDYRAIIDRLQLNGSTLTITDSIQQTQPHIEKEQISRVFYQQAEPFSAQKAMFERRGIRRYQNPSHITEQNEQESYRNNEQQYRHREHYQYQKQPTIQGHDSLGEEDEEYYENPYTQERQQTEGNADPPVHAHIEPAQSREREIEVTFKPTQQGGSYEQALDEEIL